MKKLTCPHCGFSKEIPADKIPPGVKRLTCPACRQIFPLESAAAPPPPTPVDAAADAFEPSDPDLVVITCPHCAEKKEVPREKIPNRPVKVVCRKCQKDFTFRGDLCQDKASLAQPPQHPVLKPVEPPLPRTGPSRQRLASIDELFARSWQGFKQRILTLLGINLLAVVLAAVVYWVLGSGIDLLHELLGNNPVVAILGILVMVGFSLLVFSAIGGATIYAVVDEDLGVRPALGYGIQNFRAFLWLYSLLGFIVGGGYLLFFLPGVIFTLWFLFAQYILAKDDVRGMEALLKSREMVRGHCWGVAGRVLLLALVGTLVSLIPFVGIFLNLLLIPFTLIYYHEIYRDLEGIKGSVSYDVSRGTKTKWLLAGTAGYVVVPAIGLALLGPGLWQSWSQLNIQTSGGIFESSGSSAVARGRLSLGQRTYAPGESIAVDFTAPSGLPSDAWVGIIPSEIPHGDESRNDNHDLSYQYLSGQTGGTLEFSAPYQPGRYDLRMHDTDSGGVEIASVSFTVEGEGGAEVERDNGPHSLDLEKDRFDPGEQILLRFAGIQNPAAQDWISLYKVGADNQSYGEYYYLGSRESGELTFSAPRETGRYEFRLFLNWPDGGYADAARSVVFTVGAEESTQADSWSGENTATASVSFDSPAPEQSPATVYAPLSGDQPEQVMVYVYAINYQGSVRLNGDEIYPIKGERDMNYNYTGNATLNRGSNTFEVEYEALPDPWMTEIKLKVFKYNWDSGAETVYGEWVIKDAEGRQSYEVILGD